MSRRASFTTLLFILGLVVAASTAGGQQAAVPAPQTAAGAGNDPVVANVFGQNITEKQVMEVIEQMARQRQLPNDQMQKKDTLLYRDALDTLIGFALLRNEAQDLNLTVDKAKADEAWQTVVKRFPSEDQFQKALQSQGLTEADARKKMEESLLYQQVIDKAVANVPPPAETDVRKFYDDNPKFFVTPEQVHAAHILLKVDAKATPEQKAEVKTKLEGIRADIEGKKITFAEAAAKYSEDKSNSEKGGDLGFFPRGKMVKPFEDAAFAAKPGTTSDVVETPLGYHLINTIEIKAPGNIPFEDARKNIVSFLERKSKQDAINQHIDGLRQKAKVETVMTDEEWSKRHTAK